MATEARLLSQGFWRALVPALLLALAFLVQASDASAQLRQPAGVPAAGSEPGAIEGTVPGDVEGNLSDAEVWRAVRKGIEGRVSIPDQKAGVLVQSEGDNWRAIRNGPLPTFGTLVMGGMIALLALFFLLRGRIRIEEGRSSRSITRFLGVERGAHWLLATSFILLALSGLNILYGKHTLLPLLGPEIFAAITHFGKLLHNYVAFAFMAALVVVFVLWVAHNIPGPSDLVWLAKGGGLFSRGVHPPARKFNAGQKVIFWLVVLGGLSLSLSGVALLLPFQFAFFAKTFAAINLLGFNLPTDLTALQEMQLSSLWHSAVALFMIAVILAHIYIGSLGMEGAFDAMGSGEVDLNWAREHHSLWVEDKLAGEGAASSRHAQPAE